MKTMEQTMIEAGRFYTIASASGSVIEAVDGAENGADIRLGKYTHSAAQEWAFDRVGESVYRIRNRANGKLMDLMMAGTANGTWLHLWEDVSGTSQMWMVEPNHEGLVRLRSQWAGGRCVDTVGMGCPVGAILQVWQETGAADQLWRIQEVKERTAPAAEEVKPEEPAAVAEAAVETAPAAEEVKPAAEAEAAAPAVPAEEPAAEEKAAAPVVEEKAAAPAVKAEEPVAEEVKPAAEAKPAAKAAAKTTTRKKCATRKKSTKKASK